MTQDFPLRTGPRSARLAWDMRFHSCSSGRALGKRSLEQYGLSRTRAAYYEKRKRAVQKFVIRVTVKRNHRMAAIEAKRSHW